MKNTKGFSLIELSVVIVIIGLIIGGIFGGAAMIRNAELNAVLVEQDIYAKAVKEFMDKYQALPGDMNNAATVWGTDGACSNAYDATFKTATCSGNGDGMIGDWIDGGTTRPHEWFRAWQQLSNAGFVDKQFTGVRGIASTQDSDLDLNIPASRMEGAGWTLLHIANSVDNNWFFAPTSGHVLLFGVTTTGIADGMALLPVEALNIDTKIDDGLGMTGNVRTSTWNRQPDCVSNTSNTTTYRTFYTSAPACNLFFFLGF